MQPVELQAAKAYSEGVGLKESISIITLQEINKGLTKKLLKFVANVERTELDRLLNEINNIPE